MKRQPIEMIANMLQAFVSQADDKILDLLEKAAGEFPQQFPQKLLNMIDAEETQFPNLNVIESEQLFVELNEFGDKWFAGTWEAHMQGFENYLNMKFCCDNPYLTDDQILVNLFNKVNPGQKIERNEIFELTGEHEALKNLIISESFVYDEAGNVTASSLLPKAWSDERNMVMIDLNYVDLDPDEVFTPLVIDYANRKVYFSLQGDRDKLFDPKSYEGWMQDHIDMLSQAEEDMQLSEHELNMKYPTRVISLEDAFQRMGRDMKFDDSKMLDLIAFTESGMFPNENEFDGLDEKEATARVAKLREKFYLRLADMYSITGGDTDAIIETILEKAHETIKVLHEEWKLEHA